VFLALLKPEVDGNSTYEAADRRCQWYNERLFMELISLMRSVVQRLISMLLLLAIYAKVTPTLYLSSGRNGRNHVHLIRLICKMRSRCRLSRCSRPFTVRQVACTKRIYPNGFSLIPLPKIRSTLLEHVTVHSLSAQNLPS
jgi:hypothetical protein